MQDPAAKEIAPNALEPAGLEGDLRYASDPTPEQAAALPKLTLSPVEIAQSYQERCAQSLRLAEEAFAKTGSWVIFFREILGVDGVVRRLFTDPDELARFIEGPEYGTLQEMLAAVRSQDQSKSDSAEPERMITIRIPRSLHDLLRVESEACDLSINKLCISKLLQPIESRFIPEQRGRRRGRRPGPQGARSRRLSSSTMPDSLAE
ncbi:MAG: hypothetical protein AAFU85_15160 [Planctomycetota bacterium]